MPRRARTALAGAGLGVVAMAITWYLAHDVAAFRAADAHILGGFLQLHRPGLNRITWAIATLCNPMPYVILAAIPVAIALLRGRRRVAVGLFVLLIGANETTELIKPLLGGARDPVPGLLLSSTTWPSGHATAVMSLALAMVIGVSARWRPLVGALMAAFSIAVVYSFLELGWHYPSDVLGGFEVASVWGLLTVAGLWTYEAHRPRPAQTAAAAPPRFSLGTALAPAAVLIAGGLGLVAAVTLARPHQVLGYVGAHSAFVVGAAAIAVLSFACASGMNLLLRRPVAGDPTAQR